MMPPLWQAFPIINSQLMAVFLSLTMKQALLGLVHVPGRRKAAHLHHELFELEFFTRQ